MQQAAKDAAKAGAKEAAEEVGDFAKAHKKEIIHGGLNVGKHVGKEFIRGVTRPKTSHQSALSKIGTIKPTTRLPKKVPFVNGKGPAKILKKIPFVNGKGPLKIPRIPTIKQTAEPIAEEEN